MLGGSRVQIGGPTGAFIVIVYGVVEQYGVEGLIISTIISGFILVLFGILKLGVLLKFIPHPLVVGFTSGITLVIFSTQIKDALGLDIIKLPSEFIGKWEVYITHIKEINISALIITIITILISIFSKKLIKKVPGSFISIILMTLIVNIFNIPVSTIQTFFGNIPNSFSFSIPTFDFNNLSNYFKPAITIALLGGIESLLSAVVSDGMIGGTHRSNTELIAQGFANIVTPFFGGIPATGAIARTATNVKNGGRTPIAGIVHSITLLFIMLFLGKWAKLIPMSCLAGILIVVSYNMSEWRTFKSILKGSWFDSIILILTFLLTVFVDLTIAIEIGIVLSSLIFMKRMSDSVKIHIHDKDIDVIENINNIPKDISIYEISGPLFFGTAKEYVELILNSDLKCKILIIRMRHVPFIDSTGLHNLEDIFKILNKSEINVELLEVNDIVTKTLKKHDFFKEIKNSNSLQDILKKYN